MNLFNTAPAKKLQTTHLINQTTVHAAPVLAFLFSIIMQIYSK